MTDFIAPDMNLTIHPIGRHQTKQRKFITKCYHQLRTEGHHWAFTTDPDEYIMINPAVQDPKTAMYKLNVSSFIVPKHEEPGSVLKLLHQIERTNETNVHISGHPCIDMFRKQFQSSTRMTSTETQWINKHFGIPPEIETANLNTFIWRYRDSKRIHGKALVDLSKVSQRNLNANPHRPTKSDKVCPHYDKFMRWNNLDQSPFVINHYPATLEQMLFRSHDSRCENGTECILNRYKEENKRKVRRSKFREPLETSSWLKGFIETVGLEEAQHFLQFAGRPKEAVTKGFE